MHHRATLGHSAVTVLILALTHSAALAVDPSALPPGSDVVLTLDNNDVIKGRVLSLAGDSALIEHPVLGQVNLPLARIKSAVVTETAEEAAHKAADAAKAVAPPPPPPPIPEEARLSFWEGWKGTAELGINGSDGNSETLSARGGLSFKRATDEMETLAVLSYLYATNDGEKSKSRGEFFIRNDWLFKDSPWGFFAQGRLEFDEFQDWKWRASAFAGPSYTVVKNERTTFRVRGGAGVTREFGGSRNDIIPEALAGFDFAHKFDDRQSIFVNYEFLPNLKDTSDYRMNTKAGYEILVDPSSNMTFRLGLEDRYDSDPGSGRKKNDIEYFALLAWTF
jgi:putative salt-induced outer membrane protein YdiY